MILILACKKLSELCIDLAGVNVALSNHDLCQSTSDHPTGSASVASASLKGLP